MIDTIFADHYLITGKLGRGICGIVYAAHDLKTGQQVAIKLPAREQEVQVVSCLNHDALPHYIDSGHVRDQRFLVMSHIDASPLASFFKEHPTIPLHLFGHLVEQLLEIFLHLQQCSVIYEDFHDRNILYHPQSRHLALVDFGLATSGRCREYTLLLNGIARYLLPHVEKLHYASVAAWLLQIQARYEGYAPSLLGIRASWKALLRQTSISTQAHCA